jgi:secondary thiamine-phosphate synthase enzyme
MRTLNISTHGQGLYDITREVAACVQDAKVPEGICTLFIRHTSASLIIQENADPSVQRDLQAWLNRLVPENDPLYTHITEGPDDMPAHIKSVLTNVSLSVPIIEGTMALGTWQGIYVWEFRRSSHNRQIVVCITECAESK